MPGPAAPAFSIGLKLLEKAVRAGMFVYRVHKDSNLQDPRLSTAFEVLSRMKGKNPGDRYYTENPSASDLEDYKSTLKYMIDPSTAPWMATEAGDEMMAFLRADEADAARGRVRHEEEKFARVLGMTTTSERGRISAAEQVVERQFEPRQRAGPGPPAGTRRNESLSEAAGNLMYMLDPSTPLSPWDLPDAERKTYYMERARNKAIRQESVESGYNLSPKTSALQFKYMNPAGR